MDSLSLFPPSLENPSPIFPPPLFLQSLNQIRQTLFANFEFRFSLSSHFFPLFLCKLPTIKNTPKKKGDREFFIIKCLKNIKLDIGNPEITQIQSNPHALNSQFHLYSQQLPPPPMTPPSPTPLPRRNTSHLQDLGGWDALLRRKCRCRQ